MAYGDGTIARPRSGPGQPGEAVRRVLNLWPRLTPTQRFKLAQLLAHDIEVPELDPDLGEAQSSPEPRAALYDPTQLLTAHGFRVVPITSPTYGYSGSFQPGGVFGHWTAGSGGMNTWVLTERHYHSVACVDGVAYLGGYQVRQGHGGSGRNQPLDIALNGRMDKAQMLTWQASTAGDNTDSKPNQFFMSVCLDDPGTSGIPPANQQDCYGAMVAAFLVVLGKNLGHYLDHATSTNRKIDLERYMPGYDLVAKWFGIMTGEDGMPKAVDVAIHPDGKGAAMVYDDGRVITRSAPHYGDLLVNVPPATGFRPTPIVPTEPVNSISWSPTGKGYLLGAEDGGTFAFGDAPAHGMYGR